MAGGAFVPAGRAKRYPGRTTPYVVLTCLIAASGGALFGYDLGVTGGMISMPGFLEQFFPEVLDQVQQADDDKGVDPYCQYANQGLQWFTSSLFIAGAVACIPAGWMTRRFGRKLTMLVSGVLFDLGVALITAAWSLRVLIVARVLLGVAIALASVAVTCYNSEMAPAHIRGRLNQLFHLVLSLGAVLAQAINIGTTHIYPWGWRLSMAASGIFSLALTLGGLLLPDTPNSLLERGREAQARAVLVRVRGTQSVDDELADISAAVRLASQVHNPYRTILRREYLPQLVIPIVVQLFHQWSGINTVTFFAPELFVSLGMPQHTALIATVISGVGNHLAVYVSIWAADEFGRRFLFLEGGIQMMIGLVLLAIIIATAGQRLWTAWLALIVLCSYTMALNWSWAPMGWLYTSEIQPLECRAAGQSIGMLVYLLFSFVIGQTYLTMLCALKWGLYVLFATSCLLAVIVTFWFFPETKGLPIEDAPNVFRYHWFWRRFSQRPDVDRIRDQQLLHMPSFQADLQAHDSSSIEQQHGNGIPQQPDADNVDNDRTAQRHSQDIAAAWRSPDPQGEHAPAEAFLPRQGDSEYSNPFASVGASRQHAPSDDPIWH